MVSVARCERMASSLNPPEMTASGKVQPFASMVSRFCESERRMTRFERRVLWMIIVAAALFMALTWHLFAAI